jgi:predicted nucleic acid-binding protein
MLISVEDLATKIVADPSLKQGCIVDTNVLFAASFPLDTHNEWAEKVFAQLCALDIPIFTNVNIRSEFIELNRRVLIPECLIDMYSDLSGALDPEIEQSLKSLKTRKDKSAHENKTFKLGDSDIKKYRYLLEAFHHPSGLNGWELFCNDYFHSYIQNVWEDAISELKIKFLGTRETEKSEFFDKPLDWSKMVDIVGRYGIGSSDAMIVNMFLQSKLPLIITTDRDVRDAVVSQKSVRKYVLAPN